MRRFFTLLTRSVIGLLFAVAVLSGTLVLLRVNATHSTRAQATAGTAASAQGSRRAKPSRRVAGWKTKLQEALANAREDFQPGLVLPPLAPITDFPVASAKEAADELHDAELVLGVAVGGHARAYPINMLTGPWREILNDTLGGRPIAATW